MTDIFENLPKDPAILMSFLNTRLRDRYASLEQLCDDMHLDMRHLCDILAESGFTYDKAQNRIR